MTSGTSPRAPARGRKPRPRTLELRITLADIEPPIWRHVRVPDTYTLHQLHRVIQLLFGWLDYHLYEFRIGERRFEAPDEEAEGEDSTATPLRDLSLTAGARFTYTYDFGDNWVHEIAITDLYIVTPLEDEDERLLPLLYGGKRAGPHEDAGGPFGYQRMVEALRDRQHPEHTLYRRWVGADYDPERFDVWSAANNLTLAAAWGAL
ncbi:plasmid pRiA4b ORF-3 family protein [Longimicrobium sp.]|uniref:plasmid pRiA4b ORF-3 family protein n=1 Tax=Longimicrobium sp. TaxID=2029185 RepID=UPI003B3BE20E